MLYFFEGSRLTGFLAIEPLKYPYSCGNFVNQNCYAMAPAALDLKAGSKRNCWMQCLFSRHSGSGPTRGLSPVLWSLAGQVGLRTDRTSVRIKLCSNSLRISCPACDALLSLLARILATLPISTQFFSESLTA